MAHGESPVDLLQLIAHNIGIAAQILNLEDTVSVTQNYVNQQNLPQVIEDIVASENRNMISTPFHAGLFFEKELFFPVLVCGSREVFVSAWQVLRPRSLPWPVCIG